MRLLNAHRPALHFAPAALLACLAPWSPLLFTPWALVALLVGLERLAAELADPR